MDRGGKGDWHEMGNCAALCGSRQPRVAWTWSLPSSRPAHPCVKETQSNEGILRIQGAGDSKYNPRDKTIWQYEAPNKQQVVDDSYDLVPAERHTDIHIGTQKWRRVETIDGSGNVVRSNPWQVGQPLGRPFVFPSPRFGTVTTASITSAKVEGPEDKEGAKTHKVVVVGPNSASTDPKVPANNKGVETWTIWIDRTTLLWVRLEVVTKYADGAVTTSFDVFSDYGKPFDIKPPL